METSPVDHETRLDESDHATLKLWLRMLTCTNLIESTIRQRLRTEFESTLPRFDLLAQLERTEDGLKMSELSRRMMVTGGNVTALTDQLEAEGLISRLPEPDDRRVTRVRLTNSGRTRFEKMAREHEQWIARLCHSLSREESHQLYNLLGKLKSGIRAADSQQVNPIS